MATGATQQWSWTNLGTPPGDISIELSMGAVGGRGNPNIMAKCSDGNLWTCYYGDNGWQWANLATPPNVAIATPLGALEATDGNVLAIGSDGNVWTCWVTSDRGWVWDTIASPSDFSLSASTMAQYTIALGTITQVFGPTDFSQTQYMPLIYFSNNGGQASGGGLLYCYLTINSPYGANVWSTGSTAAPTQAGVATALGAIQENNPNVFFLADGMIGTYYSQADVRSGSITNVSYKQTFLNSPSQGVTATAAMGVVDTGAANVLVKGSDDNLWTCYATSDQGWQWANLGTPGAGITPTAPMGIVQPGRATVLLLCSDNNLWVCQDTSTAGWQWAAITGPATGVTAKAAMGTMHLQNNGENLFILGSDGNLWCSPGAMLMGSG